MEMSCPGETDASQAIVQAPRATRFPVLPLTIAAGEAVAHHGWTVARQEAMGAFRFGPAIVVVSGGPGTGKTLLLEELAHALAETGAPTTLCQRGDLSPEEVAPLGDAPFRILLIDEADRMDLPALASLATNPLTGLVLVRTRFPTDDEADPFTDALRGGKSLTTVRLGPLRPGEARALLDARLARSGRPGSLVSEAALTALELHSRRIPRLLSVLSGAAFFVAESKGASRLEAEHVAEGAAFCGFGALPQPEEPVALPVTGPQIGLEEGEQSIGVSRPEGLIATRQAEPRPAEPPRGRLERAPEWVQRTPWPRSSDRARAWDRRVGPRRAAVLASCLIAGSAVAGGWVAVRQPGFRSAMHASGPAPLLAAAAMPHAAALSRAAPPVTPSAAEPPSEPSRVASPAVPAASPPAAPAPGPGRLQYEAAQAPVPPPTVPAPAQPSTLALAVPPLPPAVPHSHRSSRPGLRPPYGGLRMSRAPLHAAAPPPVEVRSPFIYQEPPVYQPPRVAQQFQPAPQQYVGMYVLLPDGRRTFIPNP